MTDFSLFFCTNLIELCKIMKEKWKNILKKEIYCKLLTKKYLPYIIRYVIISQYYMDDDC